eukprot:TRINITY_DN5629_c0_g2_i1.p1 TRINITY_DN5629_c0_g2~~TRINITY_DN5629_c0_g2_i1.p1  ORF type:complete len:429 (-),score=68.29 TRINITY_DN5629_c0_g2_i1:63-1349(-)
MTSSQDWSQEQELDGNSMNQSGARLSLLILSAINLFNYLDRFLSSSTKDLIIEDLGLTDTQSSVPLTCFVFVYMFASPVFGSLSDYGWSRKKLLAFGIGIWSFATVSTFFARSFEMLLLTRMAVGIGEASYGVIAPTIIADLFHPATRNKALTIFNVAMPFGSAFGFLLGGVIGQAYGWNYAFLICGLPGLLLVFLIYYIEDPGKGIYEPAPAKPTLSFFETMALWKNNHNYMMAVLGNIFLTFGMGALVDWSPTFMTRKFDLSLSSVGTMIGGITVVTGIVGGVTGSIIGDWAKKYTKQAYFAVSGIGVIIASICAVISIHSESYELALVILFIGEIAVWWQTGLINATIANSIDANVRARAFGMQVLLIHILGDAISPTIVGYISDNTNLQYALNAVPLSFFLAGVTWLVAWRFVKEHEKHTKLTV